MRLCAGLLVSLASRRSIGWGLGFFQESKSVKKERENTYPISYNPVLSTWVDGYRDRYQQLCAVSVSVHACGPVSVWPRASQLEDQGEQERLSEKLNKTYTRTRSSRCLQRGAGEGDGDGVGERSPALSLSLRWRERTRMSPSPSPERREFPALAFFLQVEQERQDSYERTRNAEMTGLRHEVGRCNGGTEWEEGNGAGTDWDADADADRRTVGGRKNEQTKRVLRMRRSAFAAPGS
ncbi:hypothetical protein B0H13DRAFT_1911267 [Mycena leptocephala]|nr:hypothetical protein B0H13DRAFT_1911267 [Mycena leptocephala]